MIYYYSYPSHSSRYYYYTAEATKTVTKSNINWNIVWVALGVIIGIAILCFSIMCLINLYKRMKYTKKSSENSGRNYMTIDALTYVLLLIGEIATVACSIFGKCSVYVIFIPIAIGIMYNLIIKICAMVLMSNATKNSTINNQSIDVLNKLLSK